MSKLIVQLPGTKEPERFRTDVTAPLPVALLCTGLSNEISYSFCYIFPGYLVDDFTKRPSPFPYAPIPQSIFPRRDAGV
jgi:hypothetical protein